LAARCARIAYQFSSFGLFFMMKRQKGKEGCED